MLTLENIGIMVAGLAFSCLLFAAGYGIGADRETENLRKELEKEREEHRPIKNN